MWIASFCCTYNLQDDNGICLNLSLVYCFGDKYRNLLQTGYLDHSLLLSEHPSFEICVLLLSSTLSQVSCLISTSKFLPLLLNVKKFGFMFYGYPFAEANADNSGAGSKDYVHIRIQQRNGRKSLTTVQGLKKEFSYNKILKDLKKEFCCNGTVVQDPELGQVIQLQGDQRKNVSTFLVQAGIVKKEHIKIHGF
ncbi:hypothetical protein MTR67_033236 [Solanum verrucosum]|uniref:SUI1 domain-containing protein n=1 Tax=Solanum verrucosum TaxID=315347 RepID=A0AAF0U623_SOLVR|nr:hypothetical protein MTR67_033236 [Solanum verrucosum]